MALTYAPRVVAAGQKVETIITTFMQHLRSLSQICTSSWL